MGQTNPELEELAASNDVDITGATTKAELVARFDEAGKGDLVDAETRQAADTAGTPDDAGDGAPEGETAASSGPTFVDPTPTAEQRAELIDAETEVVHPAAPAGSVSVTAADAGTDKADDAVPAVFGDARVDDGVIRTNSAVEPVADALASGAGAHVPPPANVDRDGREVFPDGVAPTARADYQGPGAPAGQGANTDE